MMKKGLLTGAVTAVAITTLMVGSVTVFAANNDANQEATDQQEFVYYDMEDYDYDWDYDYCDYEDWEMDYGSLSQDEIDRLNAIYDRMWEISDAVYGEDEELSWEEYEARFAQYEAEYNALDSEALDLEIKAGWYGDLNRQEVDRLFAIYDRMDEIIDEVYGTDEDLSDEEFEARFAQFEDEYFNLYDESIELEMRAGFYEDWDF